MKLTTKTFHYSIVALALLSACGREDMGIQKQYAKDRQNCREYAEERMGGVGSISPDKEAQLHLVSQFADCMHQLGWAVNKPPEADKGKDDKDDKGRK